MRYTIITFIVIMVTLYFCRFGWTMLTALAVKPLLFTVTTIIGEFTTVIILKISTFPVDVSVHIICYY